MSATHTLEDRVTKVEELIEHQNRDIAFIKEKVIFLHEANAENSATMLHLRQEISLNGTRTKKLEASVGSLYVKVDSLERRFDRLDTKVDALETKVDAMDRKFDGRLEVIDGRLDVIETQVGQVHVLMTQVRNYFEEQRRAGEDK